jgi:hypothetical protein
METGMEWGLFGLVLLLGLVGVWNIWSDMQVELATASLNAMAAGEAAPEAVLIGGQWLVKALVGAVIGGSITALVTAGIVWMRRQWNAQPNDKRWRGGPNAQWGRQPKAPSEADLMRMFMMQQLTQNGRGTPSTPVMRMEDEDEPIIRM